MRPWTEYLYFMMMLSLYFNRQTKNHDTTHHHHAIEWVANREKKIEIKSTNLNQISKINYIIFECIHLSSYRWKKLKQHEAEKEESILRPVETRRGVRGKKYFLKTMYKRKNRLRVQNKFLNDKLSNKVIYFFSLSLALTYETTNNNEQSSLAPRQYHVCELWRREWIYVT